MQAASEVSYLDLVAKTVSKGIEEELHHTADEENCESKVDLDDGNVLHFIQGLGWVHLGVALRGDQSSQLLTGEVVSFGRSQRGKVFFNLLLRSS